MSDIQSAEITAAFQAAGIDTSQGPASLLYETYDGAPTREAVLAEAQRYGIVKPFDPVTDDERSQTRERAALATGAEVPTGGSPDPIGQGYAEFHAALADGANRADAASHVFGRLLDAAANGDQRVIHDHGQYLAANAGSAKARR